MMYLFLREKKKVQVSGLGFPSNKTDVKFTPEDYTFSRPATLRVVCVQRTQGQLSHVRQVNYR